MSSRSSDPPAARELDQSARGSLAPEPQRGLSTTAFAALSLLAILAARALAPALPGSATGIAEFITVTHFAAACASQLMAAGGIGLCLRMLGQVLAVPGLGLSFRMAVLPVTLSTIALVIGAAARPLQPDLGRMAAVLSIVVGALAAPFLLRTPQARWLCAVLLLAALAALLDFAALESANQAARAGIAPTWVARAGSKGALALDLLAALLALGGAARTRRQWAAGAALSLLAVVVLHSLARNGAGPLASTWQIVLHRSIEVFSERPWAAPVSFAWLTLFPPIACAALLLLPGPPSERRAALALCLLGRTLTGAPGTALLAVGASLLAVIATLQERPERWVPTQRHS